MKTALPNTDFVTEGYADPVEPLRDEGPFGGHTGYYTLPEPYPVLHVTAITHRKDAVYPATIVGIPPMEDFYIGGASAKNRLPNGTQTQFATSLYYEQLGTRRGNSAWDNFYFNITAGTQPVIIRRFAVSSYDQAPTEMLVFHSGQPFDGLETDASAWTLVSSNHFETFGFTTDLSLPVGEITIPAGATQGFLICDNSSNDAGVFAGTGEITGDHFSVDAGHMLSGSEGEGIFERHIEGGRPGFGGVIEYCVGTCPAAPPSLAIKRTASGVEFSWAASGFKLQGSLVLPAPAASWIDVGTTSPQSLATDGSMRFFRLISQ